jgi:hypothetical protein
VSPESLKGTDSMEREVDNLKSDFVRGVRFGMEV